MRMMITTNFLSFLQTFLFLIFLVLNVYGGNSKHGGDRVKYLKRERMALLEFKAGVIDDYGRLSSWGLTNCCEWKGVVCDNRANHVVALDLHGSNAPLRGKISQSLLRLAHLQYLDLSFNDFNGTTIPSFIGHLRNLQHLNLGSSNFGGVIPHVIGNLSMLRFLDLGDNSELADTNLDWLSGSPSLEYLDLSYSNLQTCTAWLQPIYKLTTLKQLNLSSSYLPTLVEPISVVPQNSSNSLVVLDLSFNYMSSSDVLHRFLNMSSRFTYIDFTTNGLIQGRIPYALTKLVSLSHLALGYSINLNTSIPDLLWNLTSLSFLDLSGNKLRGDFLRPFKNSSNLTYLDLSSNKLNGLSRLLKWLQDSTRLTYLDLSYNILSGSFPNMSRFSHLKELYIQNNLLKGELLLDSRLPSLMFLDLSANEFIGHLEDNLSLPNLQYLYLSNNEFTGTVGTNLRLPNLEHLDLSKNKFTGRLPNLSTCPSLRVLSLSSNTFNGSLTESFRHLSRIEEFDVGYNEFEDVITDSHLSHLPHLSSLDLSFNINITLSINPSWTHHVQFLELRLARCMMGPFFPKWLEKQNQLQVFDISSSGIVDTIPSWFWGNIGKCWYLNMSHNQIYGVLPELSSTFKKEIILDFSFNGFNGSLPPPPQSYAKIYLSNNRFSGTILNFCIVNHGRILDLSNNLLSGEIPEDCFLSLMRLYYLSLANNNFSGEISTTNSFQYCNFVSLHLWNNSFRGEIPRSLMNCNSLRVLDLGKNEFRDKIPGWLRESMPSLGILILRANMLYGSLPSNLCHLANLQVLDISSNKIAGNIPHCINNFTLLSSESNSNFFMYVFVSFRDSLNSMLHDNMYDSASVIWKGKEESYEKTLRLLKVIDLSSNELTGEIPLQLTSLHGLFGLNLSRNNLSGLIPHGIDELRLLNFLDLSRNRLSGGIPPTLSKLTHLGILDFSFNNLSGRIPWETHMQTFGATAYMGNPRLCGQPLVSRPCPEEDVKPSYGRDDDSQDKEHKIMMRGFYVSMVLGFVVAFWVVFWALFFNKWWNVVTMKICTTVADWLYVQILINKRRLLRYFGSA